MQAVDDEKGMISGLQDKLYSEVSSGYTYFEDRDVLFAKITPCMQNGKHAIAQDLVGGMGFGSTEFHVLRPGESIISEWIHYYVRQPSFLHEAEENFRGAVGQQRVPPGFLRDHPIPLPPLAEQRRIAGVLREQMEAVGRAREAARARLAAARALPAALLRQVFESEEAQGWPRVRLGEVCEVQLGKMLSPKSKSGEASAPYLRNANVQWDSFDLSDVLQMDFSPREVQRFELTSGDILVCEGGEPGRAAVWSEAIKPCYYQKALHRLRPIADVEARFVMYRLWMGALQGEFVESHAKTTIAHLPAIRLKQLEISVPPAVEQRAAVSRLDYALREAATASAIAEAGLATIDALPPALLRKAFAGEL